MQELCRYLQHIYDRKIKIRYNYIALKTVYILSGMMKRGSVSHYGDLLNVEFLANYVHQSVSSFNRNFKRELGVTPMQYLEEVRIVKAKLMLRRMDISLTDIALHCGFGSGAYFATAFKKHVGITPSDYRKNHLEL